MPTPPHFRRLVPHVSALATAVFLSACAGGVNDIIEPAAGGRAHPFPVREASTGHEHHAVHGIDIAKYQGDIDWHAVKASGIAFAFIKATEGSDLLDEKFHQNWAAAKAAGVPRGAYHFSYWCSPIENQIAWFKKHVPVERDALPPVLDLEWNFHSPTCPKRIPKEQALTAIYKYVRAMEAHYGKKPIIYVDIPFHRDVLNNGELSDYPIWVRSVRAPPQVRYPGRRWAFWQYSDRSSVPGIRGKVDKNVFAGSQSEWRQLVASNFGAGGSRAPAQPAAPAPVTPAPATPAPVLVAAPESPRAPAVATPAVAAAPHGGPAGTPPATPPQAPLAIAPAAGQATQPPITSPAPVVPVATR